MSASIKSSGSKEPPKGPKRPRSVVWYYFEKMPNEHQRARCKICNSLCHHANNTSNLFKHLRVKHPATYKEAEAQKEAEMDLYLEMKSKVGKVITRSGIRGRRPKSLTQAIIKSETDTSPTSNLTSFVPTLTPSSLTPGRKPHAMEKVRHALNRSLVNMIASDLIPISTVESPGFKHFVRVLDSRYELPTKKSIVKTMLPELAEETKNKIKLEVVIASFFALTVEAWVYRETQQYLTLTAHFIRDSWEMSSVSLETFDITEENTSESIAMNLKRITDEWGISERIISLSSDSDAKENIISTAALATGWEHLACFGQMLNNVILTSLKSVTDIARIQKKTSEAVTYFEKSVKASDTLAAVQQQHNLPVHKLKQEVETRWNSTFYMMERMVEQFEAVNTVLCFLGKDHMCLCDDEVELIRLVLDVLRPFEAATRELCTEPYASMSKVIPIATLLQQVTAASGVDIPGPQSTLKSALLVQMQAQFANLETNYTLAVSTLLDPRFKRHAFTDSAALEASQQRLLSEIISTASPIDAEGNGESNVSNDASNFWNMFDRKVSEAGAQKTTSSEADNESRRYFKEANIPRNSNPLQWWRLNQVQFPQLKALAQKYLCIPATSVNSSMLFNRRAELIQERRNKIKPNNLHSMMFLSSNLQPGHDKKLF